MVPPRAAHVTACLCSDRLQATATGSQCAARTGEIRARQYMRTRTGCRRPPRLTEMGLVAARGPDSQQTLPDSFRPHVNKIRQSEEFYDASSTMARAYQ